MIFKMENSFLGNNISTFLKERTVFLKETERLKQIEIKLEIENQKRKQKIKIENF